MLDELLRVALAGEITDGVVLHVRTVVAGAAREYASTTMQESTM